MTTNPKSKCCGAALVFQEGIYSCFNCGNKQPLDQPNSQLDEVVKKYSARVVTLEKLTDDTIVGEYMRSAIQEYTSDLQQSLIKANEELAELRKRMVSDASKIGLLSGALVGCKYQVDAELRARIEKVLEEVK